MARKSGKYIVINGIDGSGKSSQIKSLVNRLNSDGISVETVIEPGSTDVGLEIRKIILNPNIEVLPETEFDLFNAARRELVSRVIKPTLDSGISVISDRNWYSSAAVQGFGRGLKVQGIITTSKRTLGEYFMPDEIVIIDIPVKVAVDRLKKKGLALDRIEKDKLANTEFFESTRNGYLWLVENFGGKIVDGNRPFKEVNDEIYKFLVDKIR